jgi:hypothetical protein
MHDTLPAVQVLHPQTTEFTGNPVDGVKRPMANGNEGSTPALGDVQARDEGFGPRRLKRGRHRESNPAQQNLLEPRSRSWHAFDQ